MTELRQLVSLYVNYKRVDTSLLKTLMKAASPDRKYEVVCNVRDCESWTIIHTAAGSNDIEMLKCVMESLEEEKKLQLLRIKNTYDTTPIHWAAAGGRTKTLKYLLQPLATEECYQMMKMLNVGGATSLHCAAYRGHTETIKYLLELLPPDMQIHLMDIQAKNNQTPLDVATERNHRVTMECFHLYRSTAETRLQLVKERKRETGGDNTARIQCLEEAVGELRDQLEKLAKEKDVETAKNKDLTSKVDTLTAQLAKKREENEKQMAGREPPAVTTTAVPEGHGAGIRENMADTSLINNFTTPFYNTTDLRLNNTIECDEGLKDERWQ